MKLRYTFDAIYTGMQSGVDSGIARAAYDLDIPVKGYVPKGFRMLDYDGSESTNTFAKEHYNCIETASQMRLFRTSLNVQMTDATLWLGNTASRGYKATYRAAQKFNKPMLINPTKVEFLDWLEKMDIKLLNGAGNRASSNKELEYKLGYNFIHQALTNS